MQLFSSNPRTWVVPELSKSTQCGGPLSKAKCEFGPVYFHAPYLVNLASTDKAAQEKSLTSLRFALGRASQEGVQGVILHSGSYRGSSRNEALRRLGRHARKLLENSEVSLLIFELTAGGGAPIASRPEEMLDVYEAVGEHERLRFCLDTQHLFAAGYPWHEPGGVDELVGIIDDLIGLELVECFHVNDSKSEFGSHHDRHEMIGRGLIGIEPFGRLVSHPSLVGKPLILETPGELEIHRDEVELLRDLIRAETA